MRSVRHVYCHVEHSVHTKPWKKTNCLNGLLFLYWLLETLFVMAGNKKGSNKLNETSLAWSWNVNLLLEILAYSQRISIS